jgi:glycosyltransferase involved in cell wall biosynthesis
MSIHPSAANISVVLCTYNGAAYLEPQLRSIAEQTLLPSELIASDDASTDGTIAILERFRRDAPFPVHIIRNPVTLGSTANFDQAIGRASGSYIALADQDDLWLPHKLATLVAILDSDPGLGAVFSDACLLDSRANAPGVTAAGSKTLWSLHNFTPSRQQDFARRGGAIQQLLRADIVTGATMLVRTDLCQLFRPIPTSWVHDGWLSWMFAMHSRLQPVPEPLMSYRLHNEQQLGIGAASTLVGRIEAVRHSERARYTRVAGQFEDLLARLHSRGEDTVLEQQIAAKISLLRRRAALPQNIIARSVAILTAAPLYTRYARGWRSMRKDLFLD